METAQCTACGCFAHRSRSRGLIEGTIMRVTPYKRYRCSSCGWRGWARPMRPPIRKQRLLNAFVVLLTIFFTLALSLYISASLVAAPIAHR